MTAAAGPHPGEVAAVVLAAGWSSRMGAFKPLLPFAGDTVVGQVIASLKAAGIGRVLVVAGHEAARLAPAVEARGATVVANPDFAEGMITSIRAGIAALPDSVAAVMILPVDIPLIRPGTLARLAGLSVSGDTAVLRPTFRGRAGHPPVIARRLFAEIVASPTDASLRDILAGHRRETVEVPVIDSGILTDMDYPEDYRRLAAAAAHRRHPDEAECEAILEAAGTPEPVRRHARAVARLAVALAGRLSQKGVSLDLDLVRAGALLHDIAKGEADHAAAGARHVAGVGFSEAAVVVAGHMEATFAPDDPIDERLVIVLADKLIAGERQVALAERFAPAFTRFADDPPALAGARRKYARCAALLAGVEALIGPVGTDKAVPAPSAPRLALGRTRSVCPECLATIPAERYAIGDTVYLDKTCPEHGRFVVPVWRGLESYEIWAKSLRSQARPTVTATAVDKGCPHDCGLCPDHRQQSCCVLIEVTSRCDLVCPLCFASAGRSGEDVPLADIGATLDALRRGGKAHIQLSGGEPTVRDDLPAIVALCRSKGFDFVQLNTNGIRIGREPDYLLALRDAGLDCVFLQFDGVSEAAHRTLRGRDLRAAKRRAIDSARAAGLGVVLVPTLVPGVNSQEIGAIVDFAIAEMPTVRAVHFQPVSYFGRHPEAPDDADRFTLPEVMAALIAHAGGSIRLTDFRPGSAENPFCSFSGRFAVDASGRLTSDPDKATSCCGALPDDGGGCSPTPTSPDVVRAQRYVAGQWTRPADPAPIAGLEAFDAFLDRQARRLSLSGMAFQDAWTLDLDRLRQCYIHVARGDGRVIPFCTFNLTDRHGRSLYRDPVA